MVDTPLLTPPDLAVEILDETRWTRHQIRGHLQAIQIGLHLLERHFNMTENDVQAELIDLRASLHKTARVMDTLVRLRHSSTSLSSK